ncbi:MAG TPA: PAS domain S-box protein, partial [Anaerolineae bacterium]|nr:PAS domain S-box protein [Anaerolineae bacterium]
ELQGEKLLMGIFRDITDRKRIEAWLLASERKFRSFIEQSPDAVVLADGTGQVIEWNEAAEQLFGQTKTDVLGQAVWEVQFSFGLPAMQTPDRYEQLKAAFLTVLQTGQGPLLNRLSEVGIQRPDGSQRVIQTIAFSIESGQDFLLGSISRDVTEQKQAEAERERLIVELQESLAQVKQLSGLLPICASCKKIRDDAGYWQDVAVYIRDHSEVEFSHGFCPECMEKLYPEYFKKRKD